MSAALNQRQQRLNAKFCVFTVLIAVLLAAGCSSPAPEKTTAAPAAATAAPLPPGFGEYWFQGKAELTSYDLQQARYGELHRGQAVLIFVTEDLSRQKQVKLDKPDAAPAGDRVPVLKLNFDKKFTTGIYPYSVLTSTFTPLDAAADPRTLKVSASVQEWCGHIFTQLNQRAGGYAVSQKSYFESEGDQETTLPLAVLEDELWNRIRLNPATLPTGKLRLLPSVVYVRLQHQPLAVREASATLGAAPAGRKFDGQQGVVQAYTLTYPAPAARTLAIYFESAFPHRILGWDETYLDKAGAGEGRLLTTRATRRRTLQLDYWRTHHNADASWRDSLSLNH